MKHIREFRSYRSSAAFDAETGRFTERREPHPFAAAAPAAPLVPHPANQEQLQVRRARPVTRLKKPQRRIPPRHHAQLVEQPSPDL